ncbi:hypothetical protein LOTGIDRAFT_117637 [Lottia gigantea]|uniref:Copper homeostasis protein cutC homolog n=1 Tax=Lottia gigantea TaxID=225164 RepID=V4C0K1_LOTGI|nr:hypothetical protein LOTGIDRAFT_117637 [Lottia gigantea]ESO94969.1 hypothetical protein LOTGIDRAFT_117637 [Lottia gigantea]
MEVCIDSVASARNAELGGAEKVELCANLMEGGTTPTLGMLKIIKQNIKIPVFVMIRPRGGDFLYDDDEFEVMKQDIIEFKKVKADGFVFGILKIDGTVDVERCAELLGMIRPFPATFHRAIDMCMKPLIELDDIIKLGFERVLTSGGAQTALDGAPLIREMVSKAAARIIVMPGGGINSNNIDRILLQTGAKEFHCSARSSSSSLMNHRKEGISMGASLSPPEFTVKVTDSKKVQQLVEMATSIWDCGQ